MAGQKRNQTAISKRKSSWRPTIFSQCPFGCRYDKPVNFCGVHRVCTGLGHDEKDPLPEPPQAIMQCMECEDDIFPGQLIFRMPRGHTICEPCAKLRTKPDGFYDMAGLNLGEELI